MTTPSLKKYIVGFSLSALLTLAAASLAWAHLQAESQLLNPEVLQAVFVTLALAQLVVQLIFFLHIGRGKSSHWNTVALIFALIIVTILVGGTLWIMNNLEHNLPQMFMNDVVAPENQLE